MSLTVDHLYNYNATVVRIIDADTIDFMIDLGFHLRFNLRVRVMNYDAPESWRPRNAAEAQHASLANIRAKELLLVGSVLLIHTHMTQDIYARYSATIQLSSGQDYATLMIAEGYQKKDNY